MVTAEADLDAIERDTARIAAAATNLGVRVPACPDWTLRDLVYHVWEVHSFWNQVAAKKLRDPADALRPEQPEDELLVGALSEGARALIATLRNADPTTTVWTWASRKDIGFIVRRMAQETAVHRWDAEQAAGAPAPIEPDLAADGIDEFLEYFVEEKRLADGTESVRLHATDTGGDWTIRVANGALSFTHERASTDASVTGSASDLLLLLWRRIPINALQIDGDREALTRFIARAG